MALVRSFRRSAWLAIFLCLTGAIPFAQTNPNSALPEVHAFRTSQPPVIDGRLAEEAWRAAEPATTFTQRDPDEGRAPTERTEIRFLFDDDALYIGARLFDSEATRITHRLSTRDNDQADADLISVYLDPMHDHVTGAIFRVSAANVQQ